MGLRSSSGTWTRVHTVQGGRGSDNGRPPGRVPVRKAWSSTNDGRTEIGLPSAFGARQRLDKGYHRPSHHLCKAMMVRYGMSNNTASRRLPPDRNCSRVLSMQLELIMFRDLSHLSTGSGCGGPGYKRPSRRVPGRLSVELERMKMDVGVGA